MGHVIGRPEPRGLLDDHVQAAAAFLDAYESTGNADWLDRATAVMRYCERIYQDRGSGGGFFDTPRRPSGNGAGVAYLAHRAKPIQDAPTPSPNGTAAFVLARLAALTGDSAWREGLEAVLRAAAPTAAALSLYGATLLRAMDWAVNPVTRIEVQGPRGDGPACALHLLALQSYQPRKAVVRQVADAPRATVCVGTTCSLPVSTTDDLRTLLLG
jgi:uncharacterized protein YyaL (SSP411 family)